MTGAVCLGGPASSSLDTLSLIPDRNFRTGIAEFSGHFGGISSLECDLLILASAIFSMDLAAKRGLREDVVRDIQLSVPVVNYQALNPQRARLEEILHILSHDNWTIEFAPMVGDPERLTDWEVKDGATLLFSGGLDSFAGAVDLIEEHGAGNVLLASHVTGNPSTIGAQRKIHQHLNEHYGPVARIAVRTGGKKDAEEDEEFAGGDPEITQRTRSFMFLTIAALAARRSGHSKLVMIAENGQLAIHLPLSSGRIGAFSTHTAHPSFVDKMAEFFSDILQFKVRVENPYLYKTKGEVVERLVRDHSEAIASSVSCWKSSRVASNHCGICVPCYVRRIALEKNGFVTSGWDRDIFAARVLSLDPNDEGKRNLVELASFATDFRDLTDSELDIQYCELYSEHFDRNEAASMYRRFAAELEEIFSKYPGLNGLV